MAYLDHADRHYRDPDGNPTEGVRHIRTVIRHVREVYGPVPASAFGPLALKAVRQRFVDLNWSRTTVSARRERLFGCACCRRVQDVFPRARDRAVLEIVERFADGNASDQELQEVSQIVDESRRDVSRRLQIESRSSTRRASARTEAERSALRELSSVIHLGAPETRGRDAAQAIGGLAAAAALRTAASEWEVMEIVFDATRAERSAQATVVRDIFESEFRSVIFSPSWRTSTALALASQMYTSRDFGAMPILADALQDAGCDSAEVLDHCRGAGPHVRGCGCGPGARQGVVSGWTQAHSLLDFPMLAVAFLALTADPLPLSLDTIAVDRARTLNGKQVTVTMFVAKPIDQLRGRTIVGADDLADGIERGAHLNGHRYNLEGTRITVTGRLWVIDHPGAFVGGVLVPAWTEIRVEEK